MSSLGVELSLEELKLAREAAASLSLEFGSAFAEQVEVAVISGRLPEKRDFVVDPVTLIPVLLSAVSLAWTIWKDIHDRDPQSRAQTEPEVVHAVLESLDAEKLSADRKLRIVQAVVDRLYERAHS